MSPPENQRPAPLKVDEAGPTWDSEVSLGAHLQVLGIHLVTAIRPGGAQLAHSWHPATSAPQPSPGSPAQVTHPGNSMWTWRPPSSVGLIALVDIDRWSFLPRKTLQSDAMETTYQRPENCRGLSHRRPGQPAAGPSLPRDPGDNPEVTRQGASEWPSLGCELSPGGQELISGRSQCSCEPQFPSCEVGAVMIHSRVGLGLSAERVYSTCLAGHRASAPGKAVVTMITLSPAGAQLPPTAGQQRPPVPFQH